jgi:hypothetical protein
VRSNVSSMVLKFSSHYKDRKVVGENCSFLENFSPKSVYKSPLQSIAFFDVRSCGVY